MHTNDINDINDIKPCFTYKGLIIPTYQEASIVRSLELEDSTISAFLSMAARLEIAAAICRHLNVFDRVTEPSLASIEEI